MMSLSKLVRCHRNELNRLEEFIFENEENFLDSFCKTSNAELISLRFQSNGVDFVFLGPDSGQHLLDGVLFEPFYNWLKEKEP